jgi:hypothetical protein
MSLYFRDADGTVGMVTKDLEIEYSGKWESDVRECVQSVKQERPGSAGDIEGTSPLGRLVFKLPEKAPVVEATREPQ